MQTLLEYLRIPKSPPTYSREAPWIGLAMLDLSYRLNHVARMEETLSLSALDNADRTVTIDIELAQLSSTQRRAARKYDEIRRAPLASDGLAGKKAAARLWVPVSRIAREYPAPTDVADAEQQSLPRLPQAESLALFNAAVYRLATTIIGDHDHRQPSRGATLSAVSDESRWLLEEAIARMVLDGHSALATFTQPEVEAEADEPQSAARIRREARHLLRRISISDHGTAFFEVLGSVADDYVIIVGLPGDRDHHRLSFQAPTVPSIRPESAPKRLRWLRALRPWGPEFVVDYHAPLASGISSYHLTVNVDENLCVLRFLLGISADHAYAAELSEDVRAVADHIRRGSFGALPQGEPSDRGLQGSAARYLRYEGDRLINRLDDLVTRRKSDRQRYDTSMRVSTPSREARSEKNRRDSHPNIDHRLLSPCMFNLKSGSYSERAEIGRKLKRAAHHIDQLHLGTDISVDNDPRDHGAHAYWRRPSTDVRPDDGAPCNVTASFVLADEAPSLIMQVLWLLVLVVVPVYAIGAAASTARMCWPVVGTPLDLHTGQAKESPPEPADSRRAGTLTLMDQMCEARAQDVALQVDPLIAVLLIVPGILLAQLDLPKTNTILGHIRKPAKYAATGGTLLIGTVSLLIALPGQAAPHFIAKAYRFSFWALGALIIYVGIDRAGSKLLARGDQAYRALWAPAWLERPRRWRPSRPRTRRPDASFHAANVIHSETRPAKEGGRTTDRSVTVSSRASELVRAAAARTEHGGPRSARSYSVVQRSDKPWAGQDELANASEMGTSAHEASASAAFGAGLLVFVSEDLNRATAQPDHALPADRPARRWHGSCRPDVNFLYANRRYLEFAIAVPTRAGTEVPVARDLNPSELSAVSRVARKAAEAARRVRSPLLFLHAPAADVAITADNGDQPLKNAVHRQNQERLPSTPTVRFAIGVDGAYSERRLNLVADLIQYCEKCSLSLYIGDRRAGWRVGRWVGIVDSSVNDFELSTMKERPVEVMGRPHPLTVVGPARVGAVATILRTIHQVGGIITAATMCSLNDVLFVHLLVENLKSPLVSSLEPTSEGQPSAPSTATGKQRSSERRRLAIATQFADYSVWVGDPIDADYVIDTSRRALWAGWTVRDEDDALRIVLDRLRDSLRSLLETDETDETDERLGEFNIEYMVCRQVGRGLIRGRCKLSVPVSAFKLDMPGLDRLKDKLDGAEPQTVLCRELEWAWADALAADGIGESREVEVAWKEHRLGRWGTIHGTASGRVGR